MAERVSYYNYDNAHGNCYVTVENSRGFRSVISKDLAYKRLISQTMLILLLPAQLGKAEYLSFDVTF